MRNCKKRVFYVPCSIRAYDAPDVLHDRTGLYLKYYLTPMPTLARGCRVGCACSQTTVNIAHRAFGRRGFFAVTRIPSAQPGPGWSRWEGGQSAGETSSWGATSHAFVCGNNICAFSCWMYCMYVTARKWYNARRLLPMQHTATFPLTAPRAATNAIP
jgi:hypothetical protein